MKLRRICVSVLVLAGVLVGTGLADELNIGGLPRRGTLIGADDFKVSMRITGGRKITSNVAEVRQITVSGEKALNDAEELFADGDYDKAVAQYKRAAGQVSRKWMRRLIRYRRYLALDRGGQINAAVEEWLGLVEEHEQAGAVIKARPTKVAPKGSDQNAKAIRLLEAKLQREKSGAFADAIKQVLLKLYRQEGRAKDAARLAGKTLDETKDDDGTDDKPTNGNAKPDPSDDRRPRGNTTKILQAASVLIGQASDPEANLSDEDRLAKARQGVKGLQSRLNAFTMGELPAALLWMGKGQLAIHEHSKDARKELTEAGLNFMRIVAFFPSSNQAPEALFLAGKVNEKLGNQAAARKAYQAVRQHFGETKFGPRATKALGGLSDS